MTVAVVEPSHPTWVMPLPAPPMGRARAADPRASVDGARCRLSRRLRAVMVPACRSKRSNRRSARRTGSLPASPSTSTSIPACLAGSSGLSYWLARAIGDNTVIGHGGAQLHRGDHWNISYRIRPAAQGHGYATELAAVACQTANRLSPHLPVIAWIDPSNAASQRVADRIGLICRGLRRARPDRPQLAFADRKLSDDTFPPA